MSLGMCFKTTNRENMRLEIPIAEEGRDCEQWICFPENSNNLRSCNDLFEFAKNS